MSHNQQLGDLTARLLVEIGKVIAKEQPDWVLVQGDTTSAMAAAMGAFYAKIPVAHIEAGIRSHNKSEPFPEEVNRKIIDVMADVHFAPTLVDKQDLIREGYKSSTIHVTGSEQADYSCHCPSAREPRPSAGRNLSGDPIFGAEVLRHRTLRIARAS